MEAERRSAGSCSQMSLSSRTPHARMRLTTGANPLASCVASVSFALSVHRHAYMKSCKFKGKPVVKVKSC